MYFIYVDVINNKCKDVEYLDSLKLRRKVEKRRNSGRECSIYRNNLEIHTRHKNIINNYINIMNNILVYQN